MNNFLLALSPTEQTMQTIGIIVIGLLAALIIAAGVLNKKVKFDTQSIVYGGVCAALSFTLSFIRISMGYGGSITIASMLPLFIYCYVFGTGKGLVVGVVYGLLQFIQDPFFLNVPQFFLDYILPFAAIGLVPVFKNLIKSKTGSVLCGALLFSFVRLTCHVISGITFFNMGWIVELPMFGAGEQFSAFIYSLLYNLIYMVPETAIFCTVLATLTLSKNFDLLTKMMSKNQTQQNAVADSADTRP